MAFARIKAETGGGRNTLKGVFYMATLKTIRQTAKTGIASEHYLRCLVAQGRCPGLYSGNRFLVNLEALAEQIDNESRGAKGAKTND